MDMKVLMTTMEYDVIKVGGLSAALTSIAQTMKRFAEPKVILPRSGRAVPWRKLGSKEYPNVMVDVFNHQGVEVYTLSNVVLDEREVYPEPANDKAIKKINEFGERLIEVVDALDFDVVHMHDFFAYRTMGKFREMGKPVLLTIHRLHREYPNWFYGEKIALEKADFVTVVGKSYYQEDEKELFEKYRDKTTHVFNGIDTNFWSVNASSYARLPRKERRKLVLRRYGLTDGIFYLYVGRFDPVQKGVDVLLKASETFLAEEEVRMIVVGVGDKKLEQWSKTLEEKFPSKFKAINKLLKREEVRDLYSSADFALIPSLFEPFGLVQLEAMSCECVPIGSRTGGIKDTVISYEEDREKATGFLVEKGKPEALLQAMRQALEIYRNSPNVVEQMRKNGRRRCETLFRWEVSCQQYFKLYQKLLENRGHAK
ncbi:glycogen synthase [Candidatus Bathyarchaeota archaeon]|nr:MAG: glycogen synthase [Candidatus Bathyarchaeota archaeon]